MTAKVHTYYLAGTRLQSDQQMSMPKEGWADCFLELRFAPPDVRPSSAEAKACDRANSIPVPGEDPIEAFLRLDGRCATILADQLLPEDGARQARRVLPFASGLQGKVMLHASAVRRGNRTYCFIGESGAGKSTLARYLGTLGWTVVADDLLPCRQTGTRISTPVHADGKRKPDMPTLSGVFFLSRTPESQNVRWTILSGSRCLQKLLENGFGELPIKEIWAHQFKVYSEIAATVHCAELALPDNVDNLLETARQVSGLLERPKGA